MNRDLGFSVRLPGSRFEESGHFTPYPPAPLYPQVWGLKNTLIILIFLPSLILLPRVLLIPQPHTDGQEYLFLWHPTLMPFTWMTFIYPTKLMLGFYYYYLQFVKEGVSSLERQRNFHKSSLLPDLSWDQVLYTAHVNWRLFWLSEQGLHLLWTTHMNYPHLTFLFPPGPPSAHLLPINTPVREVLHWESSTKAGTPDWVIGVTTDLALASPPYAVIGFRYPVHLFIHSHQVSVLPCSSVDPLTVLGVVRDSERLIVALTWPGAQGSSS